MARAPSSEGKTRLAPHLSASQLAALRAALLADTLLALEPLSAITIFFTPDEAEQEIAALSPPAIGREPQGKGDLGARMLRALRHLAGAGGEGAAILVGSDIPLLGVDHLREAAETLETRGGVVLGPADDGGYYLIGIAVRPGPGQADRYAPLFDGIAWGTDSVLTDTLRAAERIGVEARLIRSAYDIDTIDDLRRLARDLAGAPATVCPGVRRWLSES
jgi:rSAM/selenodomain-associated transferase 1